MRWHQLFCCVFLTCLGTVSSRKCSSISSTPMKFSISTRRNHTGHWIAQIELEHAAEEKEMGPWDVDIEHSTFKCESSEKVRIIATVSAPASIPPPPSMGYDLIHGFGYYKLHSDVKTWPEARSTCEQEGAHLLIINSEEEAKVLGPFWDANPKIVDGAPNNWAHAGFHDLYKEGQYLTIFNQTLVAAGYAKWYPGDPNGVGQNCGLVIRRSNLLADVPCDIKTPFFCEKEL